MQKKLCERVLKFSFIHLADPKNQSNVCVGTLLLGLGVIYVRNVVEGKYGASSVKVRSAQKIHIQSGYLVYNSFLYVITGNQGSISPENSCGGGISNLLYFLCAITGGKHENLNKK